MRHYIVITLFLFSSLFAENMGPVEYQLPDAAQEWELRQFENEKITCSLYCDQESEESWAIFAIVMGSYPLDLTDPFPTGTLIGPGIVIASCSILERMEDSVICDLQIMPVESENEEMLLCLCRVFSFEEGHVILAYLREQDHPSESCDWMATLQQAHLSSIT